MGLIASIWPVTLHMDSMVADKTTDNTDTSQVSNGVYVLPTEKDSKQFYDEFIARSNISSANNYYMIVGEDIEGYIWYKKWHYSYRKNINASFSSDTFGGLKSKMTWVLPVMNACSAIILLCKLLHKPFK